MSVKVRLSFVVAILIATVGSVQAGPPFVTDDPEPTDYKHFEIYLFSLGTPTAGAKTDTQLGLEVNYGALPDVQVSASIPVGFSAPNRSGTVIDIADAEAGIKYRFIEEDSQGWRPQVSFYPSMQFALGGSPGGTHDRSTQEFLPLWAQKSFDGWTTFGGGGYRIDPGHGMRNSWFAGWAILRQVTDRFQLGGEIYRESREAIDDKGTVGFNAGALYDLNDRFHIVGSAGPEIVGHSYSKAFGYYLAFEWTT